jgi:DNA invertase Pin-like site-specific DNA recombinase
MNTTAKAIGYRRVSTSAQLEGEGLAIQRERIEGWCQYQGIELVAQFEDAGISGASTDNRPGFRNTIRAALAHGKNAVLVVYKLDRLGRNALDVQENLAVLMDAGVRVVSIADGLDSASGMGAALLKLLTGILAAFAELEKETICSRLLDGRRRADREGRRYGSEPRYGRQRLDAESKILIESPDEKRAIERTKHLREVEGLSIREICTRLAAEGITPRRAASWSPSVVHRLATGSRAPKKAILSKRVERVRAEWLADAPP